jgi:hypothetical protein
MPPLRPNGGKSPAPCQVVEHITCLQDVPILEVLRAQMAERRMV